VAGTQFNDNKTEIKFCNWLGGLLAFFAIMGQPVHMVIPFQWSRVKCIHFGTFMDVHKYAPSFCICIVLLLGGDAYFSLMNKKYTGTFRKIMIVYFMDVFPLFFYVFPPHVLHILDIVLHFFLGGIARYYGGTRLV
jgi:hypothetical protein